MKKLLLLKNDQFRVQKISYLILSCSLWSTTYAQSYRKLDVASIGSKALREASLGIVGITAAAIAVIVILGNLGIVDNPMQKIKEKSALGFLGLIAPALVTLIAYLVR